MAEDLRAAVTRVTTYLDAMDEVAARRARTGLHDQYGDEVHTYNDHDLRRSDLRTLLAALPAARPARLVWVGCDRYSSSHEVIAHVHLVREGGISTLCNATASSPEVWERRRYRHRPKCPKCLDALGRTAEEVGRG